MNSMSKTFHHEDHDCRKPAKRACTNIVKCGTPSSTIIPVIAVLPATFTVSSLTLNTTGLCNPIIKLEFASDIDLTAFTGTLQFQVFKLCNNQFQPVPVGPQFTFSRAVAITEANTFTFFVCDCDSCHTDCCTYTVVVTAATVTVGVASINNATLSAIVSEGGSQCC